MPTFHPLEDQVLIRRAAEQTSGRLAIPDRAKERPLEGVVVAVGPGRTTQDQPIPTGLAPGDRVVFRKYAGTELTFDGELHIVCRAVEVLGIVRDE